MRGKLNGSTFETPDGHKYYKRKSDALLSKLYFRSRNYSKGCRVILHTEYVDWDDDDLKVIFMSGKHNHEEPDQNSSHCGVGRGRKRMYARVVDDEEESELDDEDGGKCDDGDLKVIFTSGKHNHGEPDQNSTHCGVGRGSERKYARVEDD